MADPLKQTIQAIVNKYPFVLNHLNRDALKTYAFYASSIRDLTKKFYDGKIVYMEFVQAMENLIVAQLRLAWFDGMEVNGLGPDDMTNEWAGILRGIVMDEQSRVADFALAIERAHRGETPLEPLMSRADLWGNRYNDVVNQATMITAQAGVKLQWVYGDTDHCETCFSLNGLVAFASEWAASPYHPQDPPNPYLDCGGWRCRCRLEPTTERRTRGIEGILGLA